MEQGYQRYKTLAPDDITAVIVTYCPDDKFPERLGSLIPQVGSVVVVDNNSADQAQAMISDAAARMGAHLIANGDNLGVAAALNRGFDHAIEHGSNWVITMDQDTFAHPDMVQTLISAYNDCPFREQVGVVGSSYEERQTGRVIVPDRVDERRTWVEERKALTSGSLVSASIFQQTGPFRQDLFIDGVDIEYCLRLRKQGYRVIIATRPGMTHSLGDCEVVSFLGMTGGWWHHPAFRTYYIVRNTLFISREYFRNDTLWVLDNLLAVGKRMFATFLFENQRLARFKYLALGVFHALISRSGRLQE